MSSSIGPGKNLFGIDFGKEVKDRMDDNMKIYEAGHREGYRLGFADGIASAKKIIETTLGPLPTENT